jgi:hypothetical protein
LNSTGQRAGVDVLANGTKVYIIRDGDYQIAAYESMGLAILCTMALTPFGPSAALVSGAFVMAVMKKQKVRFNMFKLLGAATMYITQSVTNLVTVRVPQIVVFTGNAVVPIVKGMYTYAVPAMELIRAHIVSPVLDATYKQIMADLVTPSGTISKALALPVNLVFKTMKIVSLPSLTYVLLTDETSRNTISGIGGNIVEITKTTIGIVGDTVESAKKGTDIIRKIGALQSGVAISSVFSIIYFLYNNGMPNMRVATTKKRKRKNN